ncbi:DUF6702 family protein [Negadavirga shengliensis]|uniref:DUF6702 family protein n=1 Tax=Negadavirga shengliensis TaxID=1389218 RepID=A0ABV9SXL1_9BACT
MPVFSSILTLLLLILNIHPFYISLTDMVYNNESKRVEIAQKVFWDDLEVALSKTNDIAVDFLRPDDKEQLDRMIKDYLLQHNKLEINGKAIALNYLGYEIEEDAAWFYMESEVAPLPKTAKITNEILIADFPTQQNIVNFYVGKSPKSAITQKGKPIGQLVW